MSYKHITPNQQIELSALIRAGLSQKDIAETIGKDPSSISREIQRNKNEDGSGYYARNAKKKTKERRIAANQRFRKIENDELLEKYIVQKLGLYWSPEQIAGRLENVSKDMKICHETIYQYIYNVKPELKEFLRSKKGKYRSRYGTLERKKKRDEDKKKRIDTRPEIIEKRERIGDWEGDSVIGAERTQSILTHVERKSGYLLADKIDKISAENIKNITIKKFGRLPKKKKHSITYDNGSEFSEYELIERNTKMAVYFAYPYHSWERGTNENTNGLLRQYFPKKSFFANITQRDIDKAARSINNRPRKRLNYLTPHEVFNENCTLG